MLHVITGRTLKSLIIAASVTLAIVLLWQTGMNQAKQKKQIEDNLPKAQKAMEMILKDVRLHSTAAISTNNTKITLTDTAGRLPVTYSQQGPYLFRNGVPILSGLSDVEFIRTGSVIEVQIHLITNDRFPELVVFAVAKPGLGI